MSAEQLRSPERALAAIERMPLHERFDRGTVIRRAVAHGALLGLPVIFSSDAKAETCEQPRPPDRDFLIIDWAPNYCVPGLAQDIEANNFDFVSKLTRNTFLPSPLIEPAEKFYDLTDPLRSLGKGAREMVTNNVPFLDPVATRVNDAQGHGRFVGEVITSVLGSFGHEVEPVIYPIQNEMYKEVGRTKDEFGNLIVYLSLQPEKFREALDLNPLAKVVNFSWQLGDIGLKIITHDEHGNTQLAVPKIELFGAYREEAALKNLTAFAEICNDYPDILFLGAAGNVGDELRDAIAELKNQGKWPKNFIPVGEAFPDEWKIIRNTIIDPRLNAKGAVLYLPGQHRIHNPRKNDGSTYATAMATGIAGHLYRSGMNSPEKIQAAMLDASKTYHVEFTASPEDNFDMHLLYLENIR